MLAKIHLKTACGCTRSYLERMDNPVYQIRVPVRATHITCRQGHIAPTEVNSIRDFCLVHRDWKSKNRVEMWFEEVLYG